jgi:MFS family permease
MGYLKIIEPRHTGIVPGTVLLDDKAQSQAQLTRGLKHVSGKHGTVILSPQPDDDPNNPLNFSQRKKWLMMAVVSFGVCIHACTVSQILNAGLVEIAEELNTSVALVVQANGYQLLVVALMVFFVNAFARKWGKRPTFLLSSLIGIVGSIIGATSRNYSNLLAARIIQGFGVSAYKPFALAMVGDLFFVHERGLHTGIISFLLGAVSNFSSVICGPITVRLGWKWLFYLLIIFESVRLVLQFLLVPETQHRRVTPISAPIPSSPKATSIVIEDVANARPIFPPKASWGRGLRVYTGTYSSENFFTLLSVPILACLNLTVLWSVLVSGYFLSIYVATAYLLSPIFTAPPYLFTASGIGYLSVAPFLGGLVAFIIAGFTGDALVRRCSDKNKGYFEPEYRLILAIGGILVIPGFVGFGYAAQAGKSFYLTAFLHGLGLCGIMFILISAANYSLDAFRPMRTETFLCSMAFKNVIIFGYSYFINDWAARSGVFQVMWVLCAVSAVLLLTFPIVFLFGKKYRSHWIGSKLGKRFASLTLTLEEDDVNEE